VPVLASAAVGNRNSRLRMYTFAPGPDVDEDGARLLGQRLGQHGLAGAGRPIKQHALRLVQQVALEQVRPPQREDDVVDLWAR